MYPQIHIGTGYISSYNVALLTAVLCGWAAYVLGDARLWEASTPLARVKKLLGLSLAFWLLGVLCLQATVYFHFIFDNISDKVWDKLSMMDIVFAHPLKTIKVLYGLIFAFPLGIFLISLVDRSERFYDLLNKKTFIIFLVLGFARVGCFLNGCCYGICSDTFGVRFPMNSVAAWEHLRRGLTRGFVAPPSLPVIPTQAISAVFLFALAFFALRASLKNKSHVFFHYVFYYAIFRFFIEFLRADIDRAYYGPLSASQWISLFIFLLYGLWRRFGRKTSSTV
ncbi:prolipoprotein diacylglyceryl transferase family protein [Desulfatibacillum aliphaticivorans]|uniref:prolipoprotein diacylglyceryl transferase family protein n=1 Tax=Desulfatibacillum aliphaticivorans TaxID=218208 RepID=UPI000424CFA7|nr:prolipoprotein diacylglyceryl transferase family protein [Desulfatibacillum aliphaticivorans]